MRLTFGVLLRGVTSSMTAKQVNKVLGPTMGQFKEMQEVCTYPVCLFFFTLREQQAFFSWLGEPVVTDGAPKLIHREKADCVELTDELLNRVIEQIVTWYDSVEAVLIG